jgi:hypothetical protein
MKKPGSKDFLDPKGEINSKEEADRLCAWVVDPGVNLYLFLVQRHSELAKDVRAVYAYKKNDEHLCVVWYPKKAVLELQERLLTSSDQQEMEIRKLSHYMRDFRGFISTIMRLIQASREDEDGSEEKACQIN